MQLSREALARALLPLSPEPSGLASNWSEIADLVDDVETLRPASVLCALDWVDGAWEVLLTQRTDALPSHAGQVSFPGGRIEQADGSALAAALRETAEEVGITPDFVEPIGFLPPYATISNYLVLPVVACLRPGYAMQPEAGEVAAIFKAPLSLFMPPRPIERRQWRGRLRQSYVFAQGDYKIWGATAAMLVDLVDRWRAQS